MIIGVDFDGTCVEHAFPEIGHSIGAERVLRRLVDEGHKLILFTMRSNKTEATSAEPGIASVSGNHLVEAVKWFSDRDIPLYGVNENPEQHTWTSSPKPYCHLYIDDSAVGCPLVFPADKRPFVWWLHVERILEANGVLHPWSKEVDDGVLS